MIVSSKINSVMPSDLLGTPAVLNNAAISILGVNLEGLEDIKQYISNKGASFLEESGAVKWECMIVGTGQDIFYMRPQLSESCYDCYKDEKCVGAAMNSYQLGLVASAIGLHEYGIKTKNEVLIRKALSLVGHVECTIGDLMSNYTTANPDWLEDFHEEPEHIILALSFLADFKAWFYK